MKIRAVLFILPALLIALDCGLYAQSQAREWGDEELARQYVDWARQAIDEGRWDEALAALERAMDFAGVSSDIPYLLAVARSNGKKSRTGVVEALDRALQTNRWVYYSENHALLLKAEHLIAVREYVSALSVLEQTVESANAVMLRLLALRGLVNSGDVEALARFRSLVLSAMDRYPRDPRPLRVFFEYARNKNPQPSELPSGDLNLLELALRRLPFLLETDPELAWMAAAFTRNTEDARRLVASYRSGGLHSIQSRDFMPSPGSISAALNLGLISDSEAVDELFSGSRGFNSPVPHGIAANGNPVLDKAVMTEVFNLLRSEQGRDLFTRKLLSFSGIIASDDDRDGILESLVSYSSGVIEEFAYDRSQSNDFDLRIFFDAAGIPVRCEYPAAGQPLRAEIKWERYPSAERITLAEETFEFRPADFQYAPITFIELCGSNSFTGLQYPILSFQYMDITRRTLVSFCASMLRPSAEFDGAQELIFFERGMPLRSVETLDGMQVSVTEFERGFPVVQRVDVDLDGRMETIRHFRRPDTDFPPPELDGTFDFRRLIESSESDWSGDGRHKTREVYLPDGSVVYSWDMDGSGVMNHSKTETGKGQ